MQNKISVRWLCALMAILVLFSTQLTAQKRELRSAWLTSVNNLDFPSANNLSVDSQKTELRNWLNDYKTWGMNAVVFQIRSNAEAMYNSPYEPWSEYLTGTQGRNPNYDPLEYAIAEARKRSLEFHAWINPFRAAVSLTRLTDSTHVVNKQPTWVRTYGTAKFLDPGLAAVRRYVAGIVADVVRRYDVDAIHFDDYFYPYPINGVNFDDDASFAADPRGFTNKNEWRRNNIDLFVKLVSDSIKIIKPHVKFGISPFGIWQNYSVTQTGGSNTRGLESYNAVFADSKRWAQADWIDYIAPQVYWNIGFSAADFSILADWWLQNVGNRTQLYFGHAFYKIGTTTEWNTEEIGKQIRLARTRGSGSIHFRAKSVRDNPLNCRDSLINNYKFPALVPNMAWIDNTPPPQPRNLSYGNVSRTPRLYWSPPLGNDTANVLQKARNYIIYRFNLNETPNFNNPQKIVTITSDTTFRDLNIGGPAADYYVATLDKLWNESTPVFMRVFLESVDETQWVNRLKIYPNPIQTRSVLELELPQMRQIRIDIYDLQGKKTHTVWNGELGAQQLRTWNLPVEDLPHGVSLLVVDIEGVKISRKIMK